MTPDMLSDNAALRALAGAGAGALCTIIGIDGSYSRRVGAQLSILPDGSIAGSLADGCLEAQLVREAREAAAGGQPRLLRFGRGSPMIDFQLPCGSGLDIVIDPQPDIAAMRDVVDILDSRSPAALTIAAPQTGAPASRTYQPEIRLVILGSGPECRMLHAQAEAFGIQPEWLRARDHLGGELSLDKAPAIALDRWTAAVLLFHDHEWERSLLPWALRSEAYYIGAQGGAKAREQRERMLADMGLGPDRLARLRAPIGLIPQTREPSVLALSVLAEVVAEFEVLCRDCALDIECPV